jgi:outer membrane protein assembly factor BamB
VVSSYDDDNLHCLDLRTGRKMWQDKKKPDDLYVGGLIGDKVLVVGRTSVRAVRLIGDKKEVADKAGLERPASGWENDLKIATPIGHGVVGRDGLYYIPVIGDPDKPTDPTPGVLTVNAATGKVNSYTPYRRKDAVATGATGDPRLSLGNLVFHDGLMFSQSATELSVFQLNEVKRREVQVALDRNPNDPDGLFSRGELALEAGKLADAIKDFKLAEKNQPGEALTKRIKQKLYVAYTESIRNAADFATVEPILDEYKTLCEFPLDEKDIEFGRQQEEQIRRRGLYLNLLADGREKQGRLADAFDAYRQYAGLGEKNKMLPVPEDPTTFALPEVWAAGRIDAMMRKAKDPAARKPLEDKVAKEWADVKGANDLDRLRGFVKAFGPYFANGRDAQYLLAERLTATNNDDARREAQTLLLNLATQADDDRDAPEAARATESLARLLTDRGLTSDALGLYRRIADRYPTATVRAGKTGADLLGELIADKRYLPALESDRSPPFGRYKAEAVHGGAASSRQPQSSLTLVSDGGALPFFQSNRVTLEYDVYGNGSARVQVTDRATNTTKLQTDPVGVSFYTYSSSGVTLPNASLNNQRLAQVSGHLLLLHLLTPQGHMAYCYDLSKADGKPLWKTSLHGSNWPPPGMQNNINWMHEVDATGDMTVTPTMYNQFGQQNTDWGFRLGRSMVLQPGYATVLTKEGMVTRDPRTGNVLWQRGGVAQKSMVFGDARHLFLVEPTAHGYSSRVFRAVDGVQVAKVPDFGDLAVGKGNVSRLHIVGRNLLLFEAPGKDKPKVLRLYDCLEGKDVWSKEYPADSAAFDTLDPELTGVVTAEGKIDILNARTGTPLQQVTVDAKKVDEHVKDTKGKFNLARPLLLADGDRFYTFLNRDGRNNPNLAMPEQNMGQPSPIRVRAVNGVAYAFDRGSGKRQWYMETEFLNQRLVVERFEDLPCLLVTNPMATADANNLGGGFGGPRGGGGNTHKVAIIDKVNGAVREQKDLPYNGNWLQGVGYDAKTGAWEFGGSNTQQRITVTPATPPAQKK